MSSAPSPTCRGCWTGCRERGAGVAAIPAGRGGQLLGLLACGSSEGIGVTGNPGVFQTIMGLTDEPDPSFPVVTP